VKIQRPVLKKPALPPKPVMPKPAAPTMPKPAVPAPANPPVAPAVDLNEDKIPELKPINPAADPGFSPAADPMPAPVVPVDSARPSALYMILTIITMLVLLWVTALTTSHYLKFEHQVDADIPGLSSGN
jgi:hypothetical protein